MKVGIIVLAAGGSSRMGSPKQLLPYRGKTLIRRAAETAVESNCNRVVVVIGNHAPEMRRELEGLAVSIVENPNWESGISSSIRAGLDELLKDELDGVVVMLCDQPFVTVDVLNNLIASDRPIVASSYEATRGVPAFFSRELFPELAALTGDQGARRIILNHPDLVATVPFPDGAIDIDTPEAYDMLDSLSFTAGFSPV